MRKRQISSTKLMFWLCICETVLHGKRLAQTFGECVYVGVCQCVCLCVQCFHLYLFIVPSVSTLSPALILLPFSPTHTISLTLSLSGRYSQTVRGRIPPGVWFVRRLLCVCVALHNAALTTLLAPTSLAQRNLARNHSTTALLQKQKQRQTVTTAALH